MNILRVVLAALLGSAIMAGLVMWYLAPGAYLVWNVVMSFGIGGFFFGIYSATFAQKRLVGTTIACAVIALAAFAFGMYHITDATSAQAAKRFYNLIAAEHDGALARALGATTADERALACNTPPPFPPPEGYDWSQRQSTDGKPLCGDFKLVAAASSPAR